MSYKIMKVEAEGETVKTTVLYTFKDGIQKEVIVSHFMPESKADIIKGIENREISEQRSLDAIERNKMIASSFMKAE